ncbi:MAG: DUF2703 domain-containing protein [Candidatus Zixiibacteriota bacterium]|nr:MAG: DUF2703 domain-containing protein [candidate division Zixibacteria bacterium]
MKIEFLYFDGCPNHETALTNLKEVLSETGLKEEIDIINIENPEDVTKHRFLGSPSIRINGKDLEVTEDESTQYSMRCRRYKNGDVMEGFPSKELISTNLKNN